MSHLSLIPTNTIIFSLFTPDVVTMALRQNDGRSGRVNIRSINGISKTKNALELLIKS